MKTKYRYIIFDLDHTLWDFEKNSDETLTYLFEQYSMSQLFKVTLQDFLNVYREINHQLWHLYNQHKVTKEQLRVDRFRMLFQRFHYENDELAADLDRDYIAICPEKPHLMAGAIDILEYLMDSYEIHLLTNGFIETQSRKIKASKIDAFINSMTTSECSGFKKPDRKMFKYKLNKIGAPHQECLMVGDNPKADILGAKQVGIDQVYFNPSGDYLPKLKPTFEIRELQELRGFL